MGRRPRRVGVIDTTLLSRARATALHELLPLAFDTLLVPSAIKSEVSKGPGKARQRLRALMDEVGGFLQPCKFMDQGVHLIVAAEPGVDEGEAEVITQAFEQGAIVVTDDRKAIRAAVKMKLATLRTQDILVELVQAGAITVEDVGKYLDRLAVLGLRLSDAERRLAIERAETEV